MGFPCSSVGKESACTAGDLGLIPGLGTSPGTAIHSYWRIPAWQATVHRVAGVRHDLALSFFMKTNILCS